ncbi:MAG: hypothetical protein IKE94_09890 [Aeriscardovia sp.]|nr:hypothetical protein [Aeriscardovia sp.]
MNTMHFLTFAGKRSIDFNIRISGEGTYDRPKRKTTSYDVAGRNGSLILDENSFDNIDITYPAFVIDDMPERIQNFANYMSSFAGYQRIEDTYHPDVYRLGQYKTDFTVKTSGHMNRQGEFNITFNCKPQRFLKSGEIAITFESAGNIWNRTNFDAQPLIRVYGSGAGTVGIGPYLITITDIDEYVDIDCELMDAYKGTLNCNNNVAFNADSFKIPTGVNGVNFTGLITSVIVTPRYFII